MAELRTAKRNRAGSRVRNVQGRLAIHFGDAQEFREEPAGFEAFAPSPIHRRRAVARGSGGPGSNHTTPRTPAPLFHPLAYRSVVAEWSLEDRERWGRRANALEEVGLHWRDAETQAFVEIWHEIQQPNANRPTALAAPANRPRPEG